jgi:hypothetical protein
VVVASAFALAWPDRLPFWIPVGLIAAGMFSLQDLTSGVRARIPLVLIAAALSTVRIELVPVALVLATGAIWIGPPRLRDQPRRLLVILAVIVVVVAPYIVARTLAWSDVASVAHTFVEPRRGSVIGRGLLSLIYGLAVLPFLLLVVPRDGAPSSLRWAAYAMAAAIGGATGKLTGERLFGTRVLWAVAAAIVVVLIVEVARRSVLDRLAFALVMVMCLLTYEGRVSPGRIGWAWRYAEMMYDVEYTRHAAPVGGSYQSLLAQVPAGQRVAIWVTRPELIDYAARDVVDVRTPRVSRLREPLAKDRRFAKLLDASGARWLLFERDDAYYRAPPPSELALALCPRGSTSHWCTDALEALVLEGRVAASDANVVLVELAR